MCSALQAQHFVGAMVDGAAAWQLDKEEMTQARLGGGASVGGVYQMQYDKFLLQTGISASQMWLLQGLDTLHIAHETIDSEGLPFTYYGDLYNRTDQVMVTELTIPLMLGAKVRSFHVLAGFKYAINILGYSTQTAQLTTYGDYGNRYYGVLKDMPKHGFFTDKEVVTKDTMSFRPDVRLCLEFGWSWALTNEPVKTNAPILQVGAFVEYGMSNTLINSTKVKPLTEQQYAPFMDVKMNHVYTTLSRDYTNINSLHIGVRVAVLFPVAEGKNPYCHCIDGAATWYSL